MFNCRIEVIRTADDQLSLRQWSFWYDEDRHTLWLDKYFELERQSKRHKPTVVKQYQRTMSRADSISLDDIELFDDVLVEAEQKFIDYMKSVEIRKWDR